VKGSDAMLEMLKMAAKVSLPNSITDPRNFWLGCVGIRKDGAIVTAKNGAVHSSSIEYRTIQSAHAEGRVLRKCGRGGILYVARVAKLTRQFAMAYPCEPCQAAIRAMSVKRVIYSINESQYGIWDVAADNNRVCSEVCLDRFLYE